ncbi:S41 family peptidase [Pedobacter cryophilus]|nr:S41 family peptidase [Pedobacter cryophilus]
MSKHSPDQLQKDLSIIKTSLEEAHPGVYWYIKKEKLDFKFDSIKSLLKDSMNSVEFYRLTAPLVSEVKCGHTRLIHPGLKLNKEQKAAIKKKGEAPITQLKYKVEGNQLFVVSANKALTHIKPAMEILSIDSISTPTIINSLKKLYSSDGYNTTFYDEVLNKTFPNYYYLAYPKKDSSLFILKDSSGLCGEWIYNLKPKPAVKKQSEEEKIKQKELAKQQKRVDKKNRYKGFDEQKKPLLDFKIDSTLNSTAVLKVKSFSFSHSNFKRFFKETFTTIQNEKIEHLILDLRGNGGGNLMYCNLLFRYLYNQPHKFTGRASMATRYFSTGKYVDHTLINRFTGIFPFIFVKKDNQGFYDKLPTDKAKKPKKLTYNGNLEVLINGYSFSATSLLSSNLKKVNRGIFIGEETGGGFNQCTAGSIPLLSLPNTGLKLRLPLKVIQIAEPIDLKGRGVFPDIEVKTTLEDILKGKDVVMEKAIDKSSQNLY